MLVELKQEMPGLKLSQYKVTDGKTKQATTTIGLCFDGLSVCGPLSLSLSLSLHVCIRVCLHHFARVCLCVFVSLSPPPPLCMCMSVSQGVHPSPALNRHVMWLMHLIARVSSLLLPSHSRRHHSPPGPGNCTEQERIFALWQKDPSNPMNQAKAAGLR
jgi:hypothetical protein